MGYCVIFKLSPLFRRRLCRNIQFSMSWNITSNLFASWDGLLTKYSLGCDLLCVKVRGWYKENHVNPHQEIDNIGCRFSSPIFLLYYHSLVCIENHLVIVAVAKLIKNLNPVPFTGSCSFTKIYLNIDLYSTTSTENFNRTRKCYHM